MKTAGGDKQKSIVNLAYLPVSGLEKKVSKPFDVYKIKPLDISIFDPREGDPMFYGN